MFRTALSGTMSVVLLTLSLLGAINFVWNLAPGTCYAAGACEGDFDTDGGVDGSDLAIFAADFGRTDCPIPWQCQDDDVASGIYRICNYFPLNSGNQWIYTATNLKRDTFCHFGSMAD